MPMKRLIGAVLLIALWSWPAWSQENDSPQLNSYWVKENQRMVNLIREKKLDEALTAAERLMTFLEKKKLSEGPETATTHNNMGMAYLSKGDLAQAQKHLEQAFALRQAVFGVESVETGTVLQNLARLYSLQAGSVLNRYLTDNMYGDIEAQLSDDLKRLSAAHGANSPEALAPVIYAARLKLRLAESVLMNSLAKGEFATLRDHLIADLRAQAQSGGPDSLAGATSRTNLAQLYRMQAQRILRQARAQQQEQQEQAAE